MRKEALAVLKILAKNQRIPYDGRWKAYIIMPTAAHQRNCPYVQFGQKNGPCSCGATELQKEFDEAWKRFKRKVRFMTRMLEGKL